MLRKNESGMFTVEAAILVPFLLILTFSAMLLVIYFYDRAMVVQDVNAVFADIRAGHNESTPSEHPYILLGDMEMEVQRKGGKLTVRLGGNWVNPVFGNKKRRIEYEKTEWMTDPTEIMRTVRDLTEKAEVINDTDKNDP